LASKFGFAVVRNLASRISLLISLSRKKQDVVATMVVDVVSETESLITAINLSRCK
jgi:hypothetical protein